MKRIIRKLLKQLFGINGINLFIKKQQKKINKFFYRKKFTADDLVAKMCEMGIKQGSVVFIHSSMTEFYNYKGTAEELIQKIIDVIGEEGTLLMPAYPKNKAKLLTSNDSVDNIQFDVLSTPSGAGYLTEVFRKWPGVKRSINLQHSVCAYGKLADYFTNEHHLSEIAWDEKSPYFKLIEKEAFIFSLGLESYLRNVTLIHCTETILKNKYTYFDSFFGKDVTYTYLDEKGKTGFHKIVLPVLTGVRSKKVIKTFFEDSSFFKIEKLSNLRIEMVKSNYMFDKCIKLSEKGISIYKSPISKNYILNGKFIKINDN